MVNDSIARKVGANWVELGAIVFPLPCMCALGARREPPWLLLLVHTSHGMELCVALGHPPCPPLPPSLHRPRLYSWCMQNETKVEYDKVIQETEAAYLKILESSQTLLTVLKREAVNIQKKKQASS